MVDRLTVSSLADDEGFCVIALAYPYEDSGNFFSPFNTWTEAADFAIKYARDPQNYSFWDGAIIFDLAEERRKRFVLLENAEAVA